MSWRINAYCPRGHLQTLHGEPRWASGVLEFMVPEGCDTCRELDKRAKEPSAREVRRGLKRLERELRKQPRGEV